MKSKLFGSVLFWSIIIVFATSSAVLLVAYSQGNSYAGFLALCLGLFLTATAYRRWSGDWP